MFICGAAEIFEKKNKTNKQKNNPENNDQPNLKSVTKHKQPRVLYRLKSTYHESKKIYFSGFFWKHIAFT